MKSKYPIFKLSYWAKKVIIFLPHRNFSWFSLTYFDTNIFLRAQLGPKLEIQNFVLVWPFIFHNLKKSLFRWAKFSFFYENHACVMFCPCPPPFSKSMYQKYYMKNSPHLKLCYLKWNWVESDRHRYIWNTVHNILLNYEIWNE